MCTSEEGEGLWVCERKCVLDGFGVNGNGSRRQGEEREPVVVTRWRDAGQPGRDEPCTWREEPMARRRECRNLYFFHYFYTIHSYLRKRVTVRRYLASFIDQVLSNSVVIDEAKEKGNFPSIIDIPFLFSIYVFTTSTCRSRVLSLRYS